jgi:hypothetical protein
MAKRAEAKAAPAPVSTAARGVSSAEGATARNPFSAIAPSVTGAAAVTDKRRAAGRDALHEHRHLVVGSRRRQR